MMPHAVLVALNLYFALVCVTFAISVVYAIVIIIDRLLELLGLPVLPAPPRAVAIYVDPRVRRGAESTKLPA